MGKTNSEHQHRRDGYLKIFKKKNAILWHSFFYKKNDKMLLAGFGGFLQIISCF